MLINSKLIEIRDKRKSELFRRAMKRSVLVLSTLMLAIGGYGQIFNSYKVFQDYKNELSFGIGSTSYLGDLVTPSEAVPTIIGDLTNVGERFSGFIAHRVFVSRIGAIRSGVYYGSIAGTDVGSPEEYRVNRNMHFSSILIEASSVFEIHFLSDETRSLHKMRGVHPRINLPFGVYVFAGIGLVYFNPQAQFQNETYNLSDLGTEGQGLGSGNYYSQYALVTPVGLAIRYRPVFRMYLSLEFSFRPAFTDYLDDVGGNYYDTEELYFERGAPAEYFGDPSLGSPPGKFDAIVAPGQPRGDASGIDSYMFVQISYSYKLFSPSKFHSTKSNRTNYKRYGRDPKGTGKM